LTVEKNICEFDLIQIKFDYNQMLGKVLTSVEF